MLADLRGNQGVLLIASSPIDSSEQQAPSLQVIVGGIVNSMMQKRLVRQYALSLSPGRQLPNKEKKARGINQTHSHTQAHTQIPTHTDLLKNQARYKETNLFMRERMDHFTYLTYASWCAVSSEVEVLARSYVSHPHNPDLLSGLGWGHYKPRWSHLRRCTDCCGTERTKHQSFAGN